MEQSLALDIREMLRRGYLRPGAWITGKWSWTTYPSNRHAGSINLTVDLINPDAGSVVLRFEANGKPNIQRIEMEAVPCRYGGRRYYFICPRTWRRCEVLACVGDLFASRQFHRLTYITQSQDTLGRLHIRRRKFEARVKGADGNPRPRGANRKRLVERWRVYSEAIDGLFVTNSARWFARFGLNPDSFRRTT